MTEDFAALVGSVTVGVPGVRACLLLSRDGLALGTYPEAEEPRMLAIWTRLAALGDVERGFAVVADEVWAFSRRGAYTAVATSEANARPGVILDRLDQMLLVAEEDRVVRKDTIRFSTVEELATTATAAAPTETQHRRFRLPLHQHAGTGEEEEEEVAEPVVVAAEPEPPAAKGGRGKRDKETQAKPEQPPAAHGRVRRAMMRPEAEPEPEPQPEPPPVRRRERPALQLETAPEPEPESGGEADTPAWDVDTVAISREFAGLMSELQNNEEE
jgi:hypothetical protein